MTISDTNSQGIIHIMQLTGADEKKVKATLKKFDHNEKHTIEYLADAGVLGRILQHRKPWLASLLLIIPLAICAAVLGWLAILGIVQHVRLNIWTNLMLIFGAPFIPWWMKVEYDHYNFLFWSRGEKI